MPSNPTNLWVAPNIVAVYYDEKVALQHLKKLRQEKIAETMLDHPKSTFAERKDADLKAQGRNQDEWKTQKSYVIKVKDGIVKEYLKLDCLPIENAEVSDMDKMKM